MPLFKRLMLGAMLRALRVGCAKFQPALRNTSQLLTHFTRKPNKPLVVQVMHTSLVRIPAKVREVELMKILLAVDGSPCSDLTVEEIAARPWPDKSFVKVLTAYELPAELVIRASTGRV